MEVRPLVKKREFHVKVFLRAQAANVLTLSNMSAGFVALLLAIEGKVHAATFFILLAACFDFLDGKLARFLNTTSVFGKTLDSLSDIVSFGISPVVLLYQLYASEISIYFFSALLFYLLAGAIRLARFQQQQTDHYVGLPITAASLILTLGIMSTLLMTWPAPMFITLLIFLSSMMLSTYEWSIRTLVNKYTFIDYSENRKE